MKFGLNSESGYALAGLVACLVLVLLGSLIGYYLGRHAQRSLDGNIFPEHRSGGYRFINPLLECEMPLSYSNSMSDLENGLSRKVDELIRQKKVSHVSIYFRDLNNGPWIGIHENERFSPASLMKVPILISYYKWAEEDEGLLERKLKVTMSREETISQNIIAPRQVETGREYTVDELLEYAILYSDNLAANTLLQNIDMRRLDQTYIDLGVAVPDVNNPENFITVREYASFFRMLFNSSYLSREMSERALELLSRVSFDKGLVAGVPPYITVAHKFGERRLPDSLQLHDCGIVYRSKSPYLLCVMTRGDDFLEMEAAIQELSALSFSSFKAEN